MPRQSHEFAKKQPGNLHASCDCKPAITGTHRLRLLGHGPAIIGTMASVLGTESGLVAADINLL